jgi:hypothetical protein
MEVDGKANEKSKNGQQSKPARADTASGTLEAKSCGLTSQEATSGSPGVSASGVFGVEQRQATEHFLTE